MHYVSVLRNERHNFVYVGSRPDLKKRLFEHNTGKSQSTKCYAPFKLVYYEAYADKKDALDREYKLKHHGSVIGHLKRRLKRSLLK